MTETTTTLPPAYHGEVSQKRATLKQLREHRRLDQIVQGTYWIGNGDGRGCCVGCLTHDPSGGHSLFPDRWGIPVNIAYLMDDLFESLPEEEAKDWPMRIMGAIPIGADLSRTWDRWAAWMLRDLAPIAGANAGVVEVMAHLFEREAGGDEPTTTEWDRAARDAWDAWDARDARDAWAARAAWAAWAARDATNDWARRACDELVRIVKDSKP